tara:strand:+ start:2025 stop:2543 length:519 start_codon:yes stop_codon:yes gene_type:complete
MSHLFGFPSGLSGGSKETEYLTNWNTDQTTNYTSNWSVSFQTNWSAGVWTSLDPTGAAYAQYYTGTGNNDATLGVWASGQQWNMSGNVYPQLSQIFSGVTLNGGLLVRATSPYTAWGSHNGYPNGYNKSYYFYVQRFDNNNYSQQTSRGTSRSTSKITSVSTDRTTSHITYG